MARGKHQAARAAKQRHDLDKLAAEIAAQLTAEQTRAAAARQRADHARAARARLAQERTALEQATESEHHRLAHLTGELGDLVGALEASHQAVHEGWQRYGRKVIARVGGQAAFQTLLRGLPTIVLPEGQGRTPNRVAQARLAARGQKPPPELTGDYDPLSWYAPWLPEPLRTLGLRLRQDRPLGVRGIATGTDPARVRPIPDDLQEWLRTCTPTVNRLQHATVHDLDPLALACWYPAPWLAQATLDEPDFHAVAAPLGAVTDPAPVDGPDPADPDEMLTGWRNQWRRDTTLLLNSRRLTAPWAPRPVFGRPADTVALRHWYTAAAAGSWCTNHAAYRLVSSAVDGEWKHDTLPAARAAAGADEQLTHQLRDAALYWLPPGHTAAHADSEPLDPTAAVDLRLPYPAVFIGFADPLLLPAADPSAPEEHQRRLRRSAAETPEPGRDSKTLTWARVMSWMIGTAEDAAAREAALVSVAGLLRHHGGAVEGLLLLADAAGVPRDEFAWCIALHDPYSGRVLGREVIAARRTQTQYRAVVDNMIAVVGWADWHPDDPVRSGAGPGPGDAWERLAGLTSGVHVLDTRTSSAHRATGQPATPGRQLRPHRRRGHWRRQHHGPGNHATRWVRIAPTIVNAHRGPIGWQIYRLPARASTAADTASEGPHQ
jgi:hypothetical protein